MATVTHVCTLDYVAKMLGEDPELLEAIVYNDDNLTYGAIISVYTGPEETITALTDGGIDELNDRLRAARTPPKLGAPSSTALSMTQNSSPASRPSHRDDDRSATVEI